MQPALSNLRKRKMQATCLALVAGYVDGYALRLFGAYVSFMSGNTTFTGMKTGQGQLIAALPPALAIAGFFSGSFLGNWLSHSLIRNAPRLIFTISAALLACFIVLNWHGSIHLTTAIPILSLAMGMINPAVSRIGRESVSLTFVTGTLNRIGSHLALAAHHKQPDDAEGPGDTHLHRAFIEASVWISFFTGAILSALAHSLGALCLLPPAIILLAFALAGQTTTPSPSAQK
jgi:uncharacterized membrane protein YoaK (UPF0700 family)